MAANICLLCDTYVCSSLVEFLLKIPRGLCALFTIHPIYIFPIMFQGEIKSNNNTSAPLLLLLWLPLHIILALVVRPTVLQNCAAQSIGGNSPRCLPTMPIPGVLEMSHICTVGRRPDGTEASKLSLSFHGTRADNRPLRMNTNSTMLPPP